MSDRRFGRYLIQYELGQGITGNVYLAHDTIEYQAVALKIFNPACQAALQEHQAQNLLRQHLLLISQSPHPAIVPILRAGPVGQWFFLAMPYLAGGNLASKLRSGPLPGEQIAAILQRIGPALDFAHRRGIHHGALTPHNILFDDQGQAFIADFGLLRLLQRLTPTLAGSGNTTYSSPEQLLRDPGRTDHRADLYALGTLLYEMLTGSPPYTAQDTSTVIWSHFFQPVPLVKTQRPDLAPSWQPVINRALAKQPAERFQTAGDLAEAVTLAAAPPPDALTRLRQIAQDRFNSEMARWRGQRRQSPAPKVASNPARKRRWPWALLFLILTIATLFMALLTRWPIVGARIADPLRVFIGDAGVTTLETILFQVQDQLAQAKTALGLTQPEPPWQINEPLANAPTPPPASPTPLATLPPPHLVTPAIATPAETQVLPSPTATPQRSEWESLTPIQPLGDMAGEGVWQPYLTGSTGVVVAQRTFLQPDSDRPLSVVAVVAIDLTQTRLNFILGTEDPAVPDGPRGNGRIPPLDMTPGRLLATFNGGFKATHGVYGAMAGGIVAIPARAGYATIVIESDGGARIGEWGRDLFPSSDYLAYRQNANLIIQAGEINPKVYSDTLKDWGGTINGEIITWRSGLGLSPRGEILYYFAGPGLSMPALARAMQAVGVSNALLLDINEYWVHFAAIESHSDKLTAIPLFAQGMDIHTDRYLRTAERDFFYVTIR